MKKFSWGTGIALVYGTFAVSMLVMVFISRAHDPGLVQKDYYNLDINYQAHLDSKINTTALAVKPTATYDAPNQQVIVQLPEGMFAAEGTIKMYRSATVADDQYLPMKGQNQVLIPTSKLVGGRWHLELTWIAGTQHYYFETTVTLPSV